jgi:type II secretory pathway pseudopilin PulG
MRRTLAITRARRTRPRSAQRGATLIEAMVAGAVFAIGLLGLLAAQTVGAKQNWMASRETRATAIALDALNSVRQWPYPSAADSRLNNNDANDAAVLVSGSISTLPAPADFELDLNQNPGTFAPPLPITAIDGAANFKRFLHVAPVLAADGVSVIGITVSVVVAWPEDLGARQVVFPMVKYDPALNLATIPGI